MAERLPEGSNTPPSFQNRAQRRQATNQSAFREQVFWHSRLGELKDQLVSSGQAWGRVSREQNGHFAKMIYQGDSPFIYDYLAVRKSLPIMIDRAYRFYLKKGFIRPEFLHFMENEDLFSAKVGKDKVSLSDIEKMPLPLSLADIKKINRMFATTRFNKGTNQQQLVRESMIFLATQAVARPDERIELPNSLRPLVMRLEDYFDYYTDLMKDSNLEAWDETNFSLAMMYASYLPWALGSYIPARLGITPSSAIKFYRRRAETSSLPTFSWKIIFKRIEPQTREAFRKNSLPEDFQKYIHFDEEMDSRVTALLFNHYGSQSLNDQETTQLYEDNEKLFELLTVSWNAISRNIGRSPSKNLRFSLDNMDLIEEVVVTRQYQQTLMFIVKFADGKTHLTLEIDQEGNYYGFPAKLMIDNPQIADQTIGNVLTLILDKFKVKEAAELGEPISIMRYTASPEVTDVSEGRLDDVALKRIKRSRPMTPIARILAKEPSELPGRSEKQRRQFRVIYSRSKVLEALGRKARPKDVERVMGEIRRFEFGQASISHLDWSGGRKESLRVGDLRVILEPIGRNMFVLEKVGHRKEVYKGYGDSGEFHER